MTRAKIRISLRRLQGCDIAAVTAIYALYVEKSLATFETVAPSVKDMRKRLDRLASAGYPALVALGVDGESRDEVLGYAYATRYKARAGYKYTLEDSVYVKSAYVRQGIGRELLRGLIVEAENRGF